MPREGLMDSLEDAGLAVAIVMSPGSTELSVTLDAGKFETSCDTVPKYGVSSKECWRESGVAELLEANRIGR